MNSINAYSNKENIEIPDIPGVSLVAYYPEKPLALEQLIIELQQLLKNRFAENFIPYKLGQVHATVIGCEGVLTELGIINKWFYELRNEVRYIDYAGLLNFIANTNLLPLNLNFGGYKPDYNYQFLSRNQHPAIRSFQLQASGDRTLIPIIIGWSLQDSIITTDLDRLRRNLQQFNLLHKYHKLPQDTDNDFYLRLGTIKGKFDLKSIANVRQEINCYLQNARPIKITLKRDNLAFVNYQDLSLPLKTTEVCTLCELNQNLNFIQKLYR